VKASPHAQEIEGGKYLKLMCLGALIGPAAFLARFFSPPFTGSPTFSGMTFRTRSARPRRPGISSSDVRLRLHRAAGRVGGAGRGAGNGLRWMWSAGHASGARPPPRAGPFPPVRVAYGRARIFNERRHGMANLVAIAYDDVDQAQQVMGTLGGLVKEHSLTLEDAVIVEHRGDGKVKLHQPSLAGAGAAGGALWGGLIGLIFLMPLLGAAVGAASGAAAGAVSDYGIDDKFMKELGEKMDPGAAAIFVLVKEATADKVVPEISKYGGHVIQSSLSNEQETALQEALDNRGASA
jgi:uncharacterized membrane protein